MTFRVPDQFVGKTLRQVRQQVNGAFRPDILASWMGLNEDTPLVKDQLVTMPDSYLNSGEHQFLQGTFKPGAKTAEEVANEVIAAAQKEIDAEISFLDQYKADNPFAFDEELARKSAQQQYSPYYTELLDDYIGNVGIKRDTLESDKALLKALRTSQEGTSGEATRSYDRAVAQASEGFSGQGMFYSGIKKRALGAGEVQREKQIQGVATDVLQQKRDIGREEEASIEGGILQRKGEAITQYNVPFEQAYKRRFPTGTGTSMEGYTIPEYSRF